MKFGPKALILGIAIGAVGVALALRLKQILEERDPDSLVDRIGEDLRALEARVGSLGHS